MKKDKPNPASRRGLDAGVHKLPPLPNIKLGNYRHYKGGKYKVIGVGRHSETLEPLVIYVHDGQYWIRPAKMFLEKVNVEGKLLPRFSLLEQ